MKLSIGRRSGQPFLGLNERIIDGAQAPNEAVGGSNVRVARGALESRPGITHAFDVSRPTNYYATLGATGRVSFPSADQFAVVNQMPRWTWVFSFRTPTSFPATGWLLHRGVTISATQYEQGVSFNSAGKVTVALVDSAGGDKSFDSGSNVLAANTNYVLTITRYDTNAYIHWGTEAVSADPSTAMGTTAVLGETDHPVPDGGSAHLVCFGAEYTLVGTSYADYLTAGAELHEATLLQYYAANADAVPHCEFGWNSFADPLDPRCALHCRFEAASGNFTDLSSHANDSDATNAITYQQTTNSFVEESAIVQMIAEFTKASDEERIVEVVDGSISASDYHV